MSMIKRRWNPKEDELLQKLVEVYGAENWSLIGQLMSSRSRKSCRFWWCNQLNHLVDHQTFTLKEDNTIIKSHGEFIIPEPSTSLSPCGSNMSNLGLSRLPQLILYRPSAQVGVILTLSLVALVMPDPLKDLCLSLPRFKSTKNLNLVNRIEQIG
ncbi:hypothetical protein R3W88_033548 [Solanum pinnatisectum]|uniref:Uncharacterized protein n=1 Tax=Solanum pinnatisectum TaxID=50273 RepID=A0AAV9K2F9_9SOLN|nr:hypothetical protein R3W88_033548 [Solanum pinnatisectum]